MTGIMPQRPLDSPQVGPMLQIVKFKYNFVVLLESVGGLESRNFEPDLFQSAYADEVLLPAISSSVFKNQGQMSQQKKNQWKIDKKNKLSPHHVLGM